MRRKRQSPTVASASAGIVDHEFEASVPRWVKVFDPQEACRKIAELVGGSVSQAPRGHRDELNDGTAAQHAEFEAERATAHLSHEDARRHRMLTRLANDDIGGRRPALVATNQQINALAKLIEEAPHFSTMLQFVHAAMVVSHKLRRPLAVPPILLLGGPGLGKTYVAKRMAEVLGSTFHLFAMNAAPSMFMLAGLATAWRGASPGRLATMFVDGGSASPVCVFDEIDKAVTLNATDRPFDLLHSIFERENSSQFKDDFYDMSFDCSHLVSIATANSIDHLPASLIDRLLVFRIEMPSHDERLRLARRIVADTAKRLGLGDRLQASEGALDVLAELPPRRIARALMIALPACFAAGQDSVTAADVRHAVVALDAWLAGEQQRGIGFLAS